MQLYSREFTWRISNKFANKFLAKCLLRRQSLKNVTKANKKIMYIQYLQQNLDDKFKPGEQYSNLISPNAAPDTFNFSMPKSYSIPITLCRLVHVLRSRFIWKELIRLFQQGMSMWISIGYLVKSMLIDKSNWFLAGMTGRQAKPTKVLLENEYAQIVQTREKTIWPSVSV